MDHQLKVTRSGTELGNAGEEPGVHSPLVLKARFVFKLLAQILAVFIAIQVFLAGLALFWNTDNWASHSGFGKLLMVFPILMLVASFIARLPTAFRLSSAGLIVLIVLMFVTAKLSSEVGYLSALHPVFALMMFMGAISNARKINALNKAK